MRPRVAITRALPEALRTAEKIAARGGEPILAPLLEIAPRPFDLALERVRALLFTSANGVRAFATGSARRDVMALCVGDATADGAREARFAEVRSAAGDAGDLLA